jgi:hypothetical protein
MMKTFARAFLFVTLVAAPFSLRAADTATADPEIARFRAAYTAGKGVAYVVTRDDKGEHLYRFGDASRQTALKDARGFMLFTCSSPHVFVVDNPADKAALIKAKVVHAGDQDFAALDKQYLTGCHNPFVKSVAPVAK